MLLFIHVNSSPDDSAEFLAQLNTVFVPHYTKEGDLASVSCLSLMDPAAMTVNSHTVKTLGICTLKHMFFPPFFNILSMRNRIEFIPKMSW